MNVKSPGFFNPIQRSSAADFGESYRFMGRMAESYFDFGQKAYVISDCTHSGDFVVRTADTKKRSFFQVVGKVIAVALKILSLFTIVIPFIMLMAKVFYRSENHFIIQKPQDPKEWRRLADQLITKYSRDNPVGEYSSFEKRLESLKNSKTLESVIISDAEIFHREVRGGMRALDSLLKRDKSFQLLSEEQKEQLRTVKSDLEEIAAEMIQVMEVRLGGEFEKLKNLTDTKSIPLYEETLKEGDKIPDDQKLQEVSSLAPLIPRNQHEEWEPTLKKVDALLTPCGIANLGNSCYLNSVNQVIAAIPSLYRCIDASFLPFIVERRDGESDEAYERRCKLSQDDYADSIALRDILRNLIIAHRKGDSNQVRKHSSELRDCLFDQGVLGGAKSAQHDAHEAMQCILQKIGFPLLKAESIKRYNSDGEIRKYHYEDHFIQVGIYGQDGIVGSDLQELLNAHFDEVAGDEFVEQTKLTEAPDTILVQLKRFKNDGVKVCNQIALPPGGVIDLGKRLSEGVDNEAKYEIVGIVQHTGSTKGGHYTANVKKGSKWYHCDDSSVTLAKGDVSQNGYIYVLKKLG